MKLSKFFLMLALAGVCLLAAACGGRNGNNPTNPQPPAPSPDLPPIIKPPLPGEAVVACDSSLSESVGAMSQDGSSPKLSCVADKNGTATFTKDTTNSTATTTAGTMKFVPTSCSSQTVQANVSCNATSDNGTGNSTSMAVSITGTAAQASVTISSPNEGDNVSPISVPVSASSSNFGTVKFSLQVDGVTVSTVDSNDFSGNFTWDTSKLIEGSAHTLMAVATDGSSNTTQSAPVHVVIDEAVSLSLNTLSVTINPGSSATIVATVTGVPTPTLTVTQPSVGTVTITQQTETTYNINISIPADATAGNTTFVVTASNVLGNASLTETIVTAP